MSANEWCSCVTTHRSLRFRRPIGEPEPAVRHLRELVVGAAPQQRPGERDILSLRHLYLDDVEHRSARLPLEEPRPGVVGRPSAPAPRREAAARRTSRCPRRGRPAPGPVRPRARPPPTGGSVSRSPCRSRPARRPEVIAVMVSARLPSRPPVEGGGTVGVVVGLPGGVVGAVVVESRCAGLGSRPLAAATGRLPIGSLELLDIGLPKHRPPTLHRPPEPLIHKGFRESVGQSRGPSLTHLAPRHRTTSKRRLHPFGHCRGGGAQV